MILAAKFVLAAFAAVTMIALLSWRRREALTRRTHDLVLITVLALSRISLFMLIFFVLGIEPHSDVTVYYSEAEAALHGAIPLVGIHTAYGPLFDEITAVAIACWHSPAALVFLAILVELCSFPVWLKVAREAFTERATRRAAVLYTLNPLAISTVAIGGQNHVGISLLLALSLLALLRNREGWSGLSLGFSIIAVKFLSLLFAPVIFLAARHRVKWTISFLIFPIAGYGAVALFGAHPVDQVVFHAYYTSSGNLPFLLTAAGLPLTAPQYRVVIDCLAFMLLCGTFIAAILRFGRPDPPHLVLLCGFVLLITLTVSPKAFASYLIIGLFPLCLMVACQPKLPIPAAGFVAICSLAALEPSLWFRWLQESGLDLLRRPIPRNVTQTHLTIFLLCELLLVGGYIWLAVITWRTMQRTQTTGGERKSAWNGLITAATTRGQS
jgi:hypothetical protein